MCLWNDDMEVSLYRPPSGWVAFAGGLALFCNSEISWTSFGSLRPFRGRGVASVLSSLDWGRSDPCRCASPTGV